MCTQGAKVAFTGRLHGKETHPAQHNITGNSGFGLDRCFPKLAAQQVVGLWTQWHAWRNRGHPAYPALAGSGIKPHTDVRPRRQTEPPRQAGALLFNGQPVRAPFARDVTRVQ